MMMSPFGCTATPVGLCSCPGERPRTPKRLLNCPSFANICQETINVKRSTRHLKWIQLQHNKHTNCDENWIPVVQFGLHGNTLRLVIQTICAESWCICPPCPLAKGYFIQLLLSEAKSTRTYKEMIFVPERTDCCCLLLRLFPVRMLQLPVGWWIHLYFFPLYLETQI